jgi:hypothetical protein
VFFADELEHERLAGRVLKRIVEPEQHREHPDLPHVYETGDGEQTKGQRLDTHRRL